MTRLVAIAAKQVQIQELVACIDHFAIDDVTLHLFNHQGRIGLRSVRAALDEACPRAKLDLSTFDIGDKRAIGDIFAANADVVAFPLYRASAFYRQVPSLRRRRSTIVHVTDGLGDLFTMWQLQRSVIAKSGSALVKAGLVIPQLYALRADVEFNLFHPRKTPYAKRSLPVGPFPMAAQKRQSLGVLLKTYRPRALVIDGFDLTAERIAADLGIKSYVATRRDGGIDISGRVHLEGEVICAEEVLALMHPELVVGCPSTSLAAARSVYPDLPVYCVTTPLAASIRGPSFNRIFQRYAKPFGIVFIESADITTQLDRLRFMIHRDDQLCA